MTTSLPQSGKDAGTAPKTGVDVLIITYNEEVNLPYTLRSVMGWANKVFVVDSGSTDSTRRIAQEQGAALIEHQWEGYARQKNWALDYLPFQSPWVLVLDADEKVTPELRDEIIAICSRDPQSVAETGFYINRYLIFMGRQIRHCGYFPSWHLRLFKRGMAHYEDRAVHEHLVLKGKEGYLRGLLEHEDRRSLECYIAKHNRYSTLEAETQFFGTPNGQGTVQPALFGNAVERRRFLKAKVWPYLPAKWLWRFVWMYFFRLGFLDGSAGLRFCLLLSAHELMIRLKYRELQWRTQTMQGASEKQLRTSTMQLVVPTYTSHDDQANSCITPTKN